MEKLPTKSNVAVFFMHMATKLLPGLPSVHMGVVAQLVSVAGHRDYQKPLAYIYSPQALHHNCATPRPCGTRARQQLIPTVNTFSQLEGV